MQAFKSLGPDPRLRWQELQSLLASLNFREIRGVLQYGETVEFRSDIPGRLPPEVRALIGEYLNDTDLAAILNVSTHWRWIWSQGLAFQLFASARIPGFLEFYALKEELTKKSEPDALALVYETAVHLRRRAMCLFRETAVFCVGRDIAPAIGLDLTDDHPPPWHGGFFYTAGRVAWKISVKNSDARPIVVHDLSTGRREKISLPNATMRGLDDVTIQALGDALLVLSKVRLL